MVTLFGCVFVSGVGVVESVTSSVNEQDAATLGVPLITPTLPTVARDSPVHPAKLPVRKLQV
jgi:hypothetical protein